MIQRTKRVHLHGRELKQHSYKHRPPRLLYPFANEPYFSGGYNIALHSFFKSGSMDGIQMECAMANLKDTPENRAAFAVAFKKTVILFLETHYFNGIPLKNQ